MNIIVDIILVLIILIGGFVGYKRGFIVTVTKPVKWFLALILAVTLCNSAAEAVIEPIISEPVTNQITEYLIEKCPDMTAENVSDELPTVLRLAAGIVDVDIDSFDGADINTLVSQIVESLATPTIHLFSVLIAFILIYIISKILLAILIGILDKVFDVGFVGSVNRFLGVIFGAAFAFVISWLVVLGLGYVISTSLVEDIELLREFDGGYIYDFFDRITPLELLLSF